MLLTSDSCQTIVAHINVQSKDELIDKSIIIYKLAPITFALLSISDIKLDVRKI